MLFKEDEEKKSTVLQIKAQPGTRQNKIWGIEGDYLKVSLTAKPVDGEANAALIAFLSKRLKLAKSDLELVKGAQGRLKKLKIALSAQALFDRLGIEKPLQ